MRKMIIFLVMLFVCFSVLGSSADEKTLKYIAFASAKSDYQAIHIRYTLAFHTAYQSALIIQKYLYKAGVYVDYANHWLNAFKRQVKSKGRHMEYSNREYLAYLKMYISLAKTIQSVSY